MNQAFANAWASMPALLLSLSMTFLFAPARAFAPVPLAPTLIQVTPTGAPQVIYYFNRRNGGFTPQVDGDWICVEDTDTDFVSPIIVYRNVGTATNHTIANANACSLQGGRIAYMNFASGKYGRVMVLDLRVSNNAINMPIALPGTAWSQPSIGGKWVAVIDGSVVGGGVTVYDLTAGTSTLVSPIVAGETNSLPRLSPDGNVLVWTHTDVNSVNWLWHAELQATGWTVFNDGVQILPAPRPDNHYLLEWSSQTLDVWFRPLNSQTTFSLAALAPPLQCDSSVGPALCAQVSGPRIASGPRGGTFSWLRSTYISHSSSVSPVGVLYRIEDNTGFVFQHLPGSMETPNMTVLPDGRVRLVYLEQWINAHATPMGWTFIAKFVDFALP